MCVFFLSLSQPDVNFSSGCSNQLRSGNQARLRSRREGEACVFFELSFPSPKTTVTLTKSTYVILMNIHRIRRAGARTEAAFNKWPVYSRKPAAAREGRGTAIKIDERDLRPLKVRY